MRSVLRDNGAVSQLRDQKAEQIVSARVERVRLELDLRSGVLPGGCRRLRSGGRGSRVGLPGQRSESRGQRQNDVAFELQIRPLYKR